MKSSQRQILFFSIIFNLFVDLSLFIGRYHPIMIVFWFLSVLLFMFAVIHPDSLYRQIMIKISKSLNYRILGLLLLPVVIRFIYFNINRIHTDELITAYFSANFQLLKDNFFAPVPFDSKEWVSQFPSLFFVLQRLFFSVFGTSIFSVKLSGMPYVFMTGVFLYLFVRRFWNSVIAVVSVVIYAFFPMSLYLDTLGLHFLVSTAVFIMFLYFELNTILSKKKESKLSSVSGILLGFSFLFYSSSYIALLLFILFRAYQYVTIRHIWVLRQVLFAGFAALLVLLPFLVYMNRNHNFYLTQRFDQVNIINGEWSSRNPGGVGENLLLSLQSLYTSGIGGHGGYNFGHLALFEPFSFVLLVLGFFVLLLGWRVPVHAFVFITILLSFVTGMVFTIPPPAFHRFSVAFPLVVLVISLPLGMVQHLFKKQAIYWSFIAVVLVLYVLRSESYFRKSVLSEENANVLRIAKFINDKYTGRNLYIASFPGFAFEKIYYFSEGRKAPRIVTDYHDNLLKSFDKGKKYVYVIIFSDVFNEKFKNIDPAGKIIQFPENYS